MEGRIDPPSSLVRWTPERLAEEAKAGFAIIGETGAATVACAFAKPVGEALYLGKIAIDAALRGRGLLRQIFAIAEAEAGLAGCAALILESRVELTGNHAAFAACGFRKIDETAHEGYDRPTSITMEKRL